MVWRFSGSLIHSHAAERAKRELVAAQFFLLALVIAFEAVGKVVSPVSAGRR